MQVENQFRLLREDLVCDTRESVQVALGNKRGKRTGEFILDILLTKIYTGDKSKWGLEFECQDDLPFFSSIIDEEVRKARLERERNFLRHGSFACLLSGNEVVAFVMIIRDINLLVRNPPAIAVQLGGRMIAKDTLYRLQRCPLVSLVEAAVGGNTLDRRGNVLVCGKEKITNYVVLRILIYRRTPT